MSLLVQQKSLGIETNDANIHRPEIKQEKKKKKKRKKEKATHLCQPTLYLTLNIRIAWKLKGIMYGQVGMMGAYHPN